jgi:hypothetical protein
MKIRGVSANAFAERPNKGKTMFPWRDQAKGHVAKTILLKHVLVAKLHLMDGTTGVGKKWDDLVPVFKREPQIAEFMIDVSTDLTGLVLRTQFNAIMDKAVSLLRRHKFLATFLHSTSISQRGPKPEHWVGCSLRFGCLRTQQFFQVCFEPDAGAPKLRTQATFAHTLY